MEVKSGGGVSGRNLLLMLGIFNTIFFTIYMSVLYTLCICYLP